MKIIITSPSDTNEIPLKVNVDQYTTLSDLIKLINKERAAARLQPVYQCSYKGIPLSSTSLSTSLYKLLGKEEGKKTLHVSSEVPKDAQHNLSLQVVPQESTIPHAKSQPVKQASLSLFSTKLKSSYMADQKQILNESLSFFPETLVDIISEYRGDEEVELSKYDNYFVLDVAKILSCQVIYTKVKNEEDLFYFMLAKFFNIIFEPGQHPDGLIAISMNVEKMGKNNIISSDLESAKTAAGHPTFVEKYGEKISGYKIIFQLSPENNVHALHALNYTVGECFKRWIEIDCSHLVIPKTSSINNIQDLHASIAQFILRKIYQKNDIKNAVHLKNGQPTELLEYHPYEKIALDYFLENHKASSETKWDHTNTLDEIIAHALLSQNSWSHWAKGSQTRRTLLTLLGQDDAWFNKQTHESLKKAILSHVQLQCTEIMNNKANQSKKLSR
ncbi:MAG TPA: hypothetical protein VLG50_07410 [Candidatus Saccharimonadales bacterium]|nr:hypothetical protein [Candidatus Saccharimonadales bacterium]